MYASTGINQLI